MVCQRRTDRTFRARSSDEGGSGARRQNRTHHEVEIRVAPLDHHPRPKLGQGRPLAMDSEVVVRLFE